MLLRHRTRDLRHHPARAARALSLALACAALALAPGCAGPRAAGAAAAARPVAATDAWARTELFFGIGLYGQEGGVTEREWLDFLDAEVTPRFPDGFSQYEAYGQWRSMKREDARVVRLRSRVLLILHPDTPEADAKIEAVRAAYKARSNDESVLRSSQPARVSF
jgi:hypothetical protein